MIIQKDEEKYDLAQLIELWNLRDKLREPFKARSLAVFERAVDLTKQPIYQQHKMGPVVDSWKIMHPVIVPSHQWSAAS